MNQPAEQSPSSSRSPLWIVSGLLTLVAILLLGAGAIYWWQNRGLPPVERAKLIERGTLTLVSLNPDHESTSPTKLYDWEELGRVELTDPAEREQLILALNQGIAESDGTVAGCFNPRHAILWKDGSESLDLVICFECLSMSVYENGTRGEGHITTSSPQSTFDKLLKQHGITLATK